ncbi:unnamed protein product [marine sediment metagenome]|uniref:Uncharacterized protein n=1 Tax=marine sediment metagenome TaxID=412755 RepID=X1DDJ6_9ZZZZ
MAYRDTLLIIVWLIVVSFLVSILNLTLKLFSHTICHDSDNVAHSNKVVDSSYIF